MHAREEPPLTAASVGTSPWLPSLLSRLRKVVHCSLLGVSTTSLRLLASCRLLCRSIAAALVLFLVASRMDRSALLFLIFWDFLRAAVKVLLLARLSGCCSLDESESLSSGATAQGGVAFGSSAARGLSFFGFFFGASCESLIWRVLATPCSLR